MILEKDLQSGMIFETNKNSRSMHTKFSIWSMNDDKSLWFRMIDGFGPISGWKRTDKLLDYLNKYNFQLIGQYKIYPINSEDNGFELTGAL